MRHRQRKSDCPVHFALDAFGDAWTLLIVRDLMFKGRATYTELLRAEEGIATNILADRLVRLEEDGIVVKERYSEYSNTSRYRLTPKGVDLLRSCSRSSSGAPSTTQGPPPLGNSSDGCAPRRPGSLLSSARLSLLLPSRGTNGRRIVPGGGYVTTDPGTVRTGKWRCP